MKRKAKAKTGKRNDQSDKRGWFLLFLLTLSFVLSIGVAGLIAYKAINGQTVETYKAKTDELGQEQTDDLQMFQEKIPDNDKEIQSAGKDKTDSIEKTDVEEEETPAVPGRYANELADEEYMKENRILEWESSSEDEVSLCFAGDFLLDDEYAIMVNLLNRGAVIENGISESLLTYMREADIMVINNEFPYTNRGTPTEEKTFTFRADTDKVSFLHDMGADVAILANNHIYDFGEVGLLDTLDTLEEAGIPGVGAGRNLEEASAPLYFIVNDMKIAIVAATQIERLENPDTKGATADSPGVFRCLNPTKLYEVVEKAKENSDFVVVYMHWGTENVEEPDWLQLDQAPKLAEAGADLIIGDHPHCLQGIDYFGDTPVIYSLGNFWFNSRTMDSCMVRVTIGQEGLKSFQFLPAIQSDCRVDLAYGEEKNRILDYMRELSPNVLIDEEGYISRQ